jgi:hypothetical protein
MPAGRYWRSAMELEELGIPDFPVDAWPEADAHEDDSPEWVDPYEI